MTDFQSRLSWARGRMPRLQRSMAALPDFRGVRLACSWHLDLKIVPLVEALHEHGALLFLVTCNPATVRDEVVAYLRTTGVMVQAWRDMPQSDFLGAARDANAWGPTHLCEFGAGLSTILASLSHDEQPFKVYASLEGTGSGISRLENLQPSYPVFNLDDLPIKEGLHNRHMVGLSTWQTFFQRTQLTLHEKRVVVLGYGLVGQGLAHSARAFGGAVTIVERDPARALQASYDGWLVQTLAQALSEADVVVTATGAPGVITAAHLSYLREGVFLINAGHQDDEIDVSALRAYPHRQVLPFIEEVDLGDRSVYLLADGSMLNLTAGEGDSLNAFDLTLAVLAAGLAFMVTEGPAYPPGIHLLPRLVWEPYL